MIENIENINQQIYKLIDLIFINLKPSDSYLSDICEIKYGKSIDASSLSADSKYPVYGGNGIIGTLNTYLFAKSMIAISCRGAASGNVLLTVPYATITSNSLYLELKNYNDLIPLYSFLKRINLSRYVTGSAQPQITIQNIKKLKIPKLKEDNRDFFVFIDLINKNNNKINKLKNIKQTLLSKYF